VDYILGLNFIMAKIRNFLYSIFGFILSFFFINKKNWIFSELDGNGFNDNCKYMYLWLKVNKPERRTFWVTKNKKLMDSDVPDIYYFYSLKGQYVIAKSGVFFTTHGLSDISTIINSKVIHICFWHGLPLKKIGNDTFSIHSSSKIWLLVDFITNRKKSFDVFFASSVYFSKIFSSALNLRREVIKIAEQPRLTSFAQSLHNNEKKWSKHIKVILYAPTYRDHMNIDEYYSQGILPLECELLKLNELMVKHNCRFLIKPHPYMPTISIDRSLSNIELFDKFTDVNSLITVSDLLVTDYSGILFDFYTLNKKVIFIQSDIKNYSLYRKGFYFNLDELEGERVLSWKSFIDDFYNLAFEDLLNKRFKGKYVADFSALEMPNVYNLIEKTLKGK